MKKIVSLFAMLVLVFALAVTANAAETVASGYCGAEGDGTNLEWVLTDDGVLTIRGEGAMADYVGDNNNNETTNAPWFAYSKNITSLVLEEGITYIGTSAFEFIDSLSGKLVIPNTVEAIGDRAFRMTILSGDLIIPGNVKEIGFWAFCGALDSDEPGKLVIEEGVEVIGDDAFQGCEFTSVELPSTIKSVGGTILREADVEKVTISEDNPYFCIVDQILYSKDMSVLYECFRSRKTDVVVPESVTEIKNLAFHTCQAPNITINENIKTIGYETFNLYRGNIIFEGRPDYIGDGELYSCRANIYFMAGAPLYVAEYTGEWGDTFGPDTRIYYAEGTEGWELDENGLWNGYKVTPFSGEEVEFDPSLYVASGYCGADPGGKNMAWLLDENGVLTIRGKGAMDFYDLAVNEETERYMNGAPWGKYSENATSLVLEEGITSISDYAFYYMTNLSGKLEIPSTVESIGTLAFTSCRFDANLTIPGTVKEIKDSAFSQLWSEKPGNLVVEEGVEKIGEGAFSNSNFVSASLPSTVNYIGGPIFSYGSYLEEVTISEENEHYCVVDDVIYTKDMRRLIECLPNKTGEFAVPETVTVIGQYAFSSVKLSGITIGKNIKTVEIYAFEFYEGNVFFEGRPETIEFGAFSFSSAKIYFKAGAPLSVDGYTGVWRDPFGPDTKIYYLAGTPGWELDENGKWKGYDVIEWNGETIGDANGDGNISSRDATAILRYLVDSSVNSVDLAAADYNGDGSVSSRDATAILRYLIGA